ncbi:MAG: hypothetical protein HZA79_13800 [Sphingobacteriales bacterium]|nr:hypothetical protein [Sphingobacteriales bacterium]
MKTKTLTPMGSLHPVIFFVVVYVVALLLSIFICSSLFYTFNGSSRSTGRIDPVEPAGSTVVTVSTLALQR